MKITRQLLHCNPSQPNMLNTLTQNVTLNSYFYRLPGCATLLTKLLLIIDSILFSNPFLRCGKIKITCKKWSFFYTFKFGEFN